MIFHIINDYIYNQTSFLSDTIEELSSEIKRFSSEKSIHQIQSLPTIIEEEPLTSPNPSPITEDSQSNETIDQPIKSSQRIFSLFLGIFIGAIFVIIIGFPLIDHERLKLIINQSLILFDKIIHQFIK